MLDLMIHLRCLVVCALLFSLVPTASSADEGGPRPPNVIMILVDDFGYECVGSYGGVSYQTPRLDALAAEGIRYTHAWDRRPSRLETDP